MLFSFRLALSNLKCTSPNRTKPGTRIKNTRIYSLETADLRGWRMLSMLTFKQRIIQLQAPKAYINVSRQAKMDQLIREAKLDPKEARRLFYADLQIMARAMQSGDLITSLSTLVADGLMYVVAMRYPTLDGWREATLSNWLNTRQLSLPCKKSSCVMDNMVFSIVD